MNLHTNQNDATTSLDITQGMYWSAEGQLVRFMADQRSGTRGVFVVGPDTVEINIPARGARGERVMLLRTPTLGGA